MHLAILFVIVVHEQFNIKVKFTKVTMHIVNLPIVAHLEFIFKKISLKLWHRAHYFQRVLAHSALVCLGDPGKIQRYVMHDHFDSDRDDTSPDYRKFCCAIRPQVARK